MGIASEEIFGPVLCAMAWSDHEERLEIVNGVEFGLTSRVLTSTLDEGLQLAGGSRRRLCSSTPRRAGRAACPSGARNRAASAGRTAWRRS
jgi:hypothetical protein